MLAVSSYVGLNAWLDRAETKFYRRTASPSNCRIFRSWVSFRFARDSPGIGNVQSV
jgi:hypothetical protein